MIIYLACFPTGGGLGIVHGSTPGGDVIGYALAEDGRCLASHLSSGVGYSQHDMGLTSDWQHERYREACPDGFTLEWVDDPKTHPGWLLAAARNEAAHVAAQPQEPTT